MVRLKMVIARAMYVLATPIPLNDDHMHRCESQSVKIVTTGNKIVY